MFRSAARQWVWAIRINHSTLAPTEPLVAPTEPWEKSELFTFFRRNTHWQNACLTVLALADEERIAINRLLRLAAKVAEAHFAPIAGKSLKSIAAVRAGFTMRRGNKEDFIGRKWHSDGTQGMNFYWIKPQHKEWIREWVLAQGFTIPPATTDVE